MSRQGVYNNLVWTCDKFKSLLLSESGSLIVVSGFPFILCETSLCFAQVLKNKNLEMKMDSDSILLAADSSSICPNVVVCLFVVIKLKNAC